MSDFNEKILYSSFLRPAFHPFLSDVCKKKKQKRTFFYIEMLLFVETQSAQIIFVNPLCAINGRVLFGDVSFVPPVGRRNGRRRKKSNVLFCVLDRRSNEQRLHLICESALTSKRRLPLLAKACRRRHPSVSMLSLLLPVYVQCFWDMPLFFSPSVHLML